MVRLTKDFGLTKKGSSIGDAFPGEDGEDALDETQASLSSSFESADVDPLFPGESAKTGSNPVEIAAAGGMAHFSCLYR
ncbi:hypothetical protein N7488_001833 [Penicillium malachiteum]|nr:hypothetical protein N7488_001833 [Penicillium malachiteum]